MHVHLHAGNHLRRDHPFFLGFVCKQLAAGNVANREHARQIRTQLIVHFDGAALLQFEAERSGIDTVKQRPAPNADEHDIGFERLALAVFFNGESDHLLRTQIGGRHLRPRAYRQPLLAEDAGRVLDHIVVVAGQNRRHEFNDGDVGAKSTPHRTEFEADHTAAHHDQALRHRFEGQCADIRHHTLLVEFQKWQFDRRRTGGDDDVFRRVTGDGAVRRSHIHHVALLQAAGAARPRHLVLLEQKLDALGVRTDNVVFALHHLREVHRHLLDDDAVFGSRVFREFEMFTAGKQCLGWNASDVDAGAAQRLVHLDADGIEAELRGADGGDVAAGAAADDDDIGRNRCRGHDYSTSIAAGSSINSLMRTRKSTACCPSMMRWS